MRGQFVIVFGHCLREGHVQMTGETEKPISASVTQTQIPGTAPSSLSGEASAIFVPSVSPSASFEKLLTDAAKYTVFAVFVLYSIGFLIWHTYLATYGVSSLAFLQAEYLAAAFCYLFILATFAIPPVLLLKALRQNLQEKALSGANAWSKGWGFVVCVWFYLTSKLTSVFLPGDHPITKEYLTFLNVLFMAAGVHLIVILIFTVRAGLLAKLWSGKKWKETQGIREWKASKVYRAVVRSEYWALYVLMYLLSQLYFNPELNGSFLLSSLFLYTAIGYSVGHNVFNVWATSGPMMRVLIVVVNCLVLASNIQSFAAFQFGKIPKSVGGGKPETAYIRFSSQSHELAESLNISSASNYIPEIGFVGPVGILLRSEKEMIFVKQSDLDSSGYLTNVITTMFPTNVVISRKTNFITSVTTPRANVFRTNVTPQIVVTLATNGTLVTKLVSRNYGKLTARQIRSEAIDAIIFTK
jgi:hypothetical protein